MKLKITVDIYEEESGLDLDKIQDNILDFTRDLLINGAYEEGIEFTLKEVEYDCLKK